MARVIPTSKRGRRPACATSAGIISAFVAWMSGQYLIGDTPTPGYSYTFILAFVLTSIGLTAPEQSANRNRQPCGKGNIARLNAPGPALAMIRRLRGTSGACDQTMGRMAMPSISCMKAAPLRCQAQLGILTLAFTLSGTISNLLWDLGDRYGFRITFLVSIGLWVAATFCS
jgi:hypothetical protein